MHPNYVTEQELLSPWPIDMPILLHMLLGLYLFRT